jgi:hypothetical protein
MFQAGDWPLDLIICLLDVLINDFDEADEAVFLGVERKFEFILWFQDNEKSELVDVVSVMFQVGEWA